MQLRLLPLLLLERKVNAWQQKSAEVRILIKIVLLTAKWTSSTDGLNVEED